jgi:hypothetical protein
VQVYHLSPFWIRLSLKKPIGDIAYSKINHYDLLPQFQMMDSSSLIF